jgi:hypothetical protein
MAGEFLKSVKINFFHHFLTEPSVVAPLAHSAQHLG